jgi:hypothetical protein
MPRYTKPDRYSAVARNALRDWRAGKISAETFAMKIALVWKLRGNA